MFVDVEVTERAMRIVMTWVEPGPPSGEGTDRIMTSSVEVGRSAAARRAGNAAFDRRSTRVITGVASPSVSARDVPDSKVLTGEAMMSFPCTGGQRRLAPFSAATVTTSNIGRMRGRPAVRRRSP
jgi:hypothetical protein